MASKQFKHLTQDQVEHFLHHGYVLIPQAFSHENADKYTRDLWTRLAYNEHDKTTWKAERIHMPWHQREPTATFAPKAWGAICDLLGGEDRIDTTAATWNDSLIVNLGTSEMIEGNRMTVDDPTKLNNWHVDGDFFVHFLDSPEQALLVIPFFEDVAPRGGGTYIAPDGIPIIANYLASHPEGVLPTGLSFTPQGSTERFENLEEIKKCKEFVEVTGNKGDVVLMHPLMLHSASPNFTRRPRLITNPPVSLQKPFIFSRGDRSQYSIVELKTLQSLGVDISSTKPRYDFSIIKERRRLVPARVKTQEKAKEEEAARLRIRRETEMEELERSWKGEAPVILDGIAKQDAVV